MTYEQICWETDAGVGILTLDRPAARNAWTRQMGNEVRHALAAADADDAVRAIVMTGAGPDFCVGADLADGGAAVFTPEPGETDPTAAATFGCWRVRKPIIGALNGVAAGIGSTLPLQFDIRLAGESTRIAFVFVRRGLTPEAASTWFLQRLVGLGAAAEILLTGRIVSAPEALALGLVSRVVADDALLPAALEIGRGIAEGTGPCAVALTKELLWRAAGEASPAQAERRDARVFGWAKRSAEGREGLRAFVEKRAAVWPLSPTRDLPSIDDLDDEEPA
jgi:enoyl-CoA hydratase/carnithine racemase